MLPAYLADVFGQKHVGAIHGRALTAWSASALFGPLLLSKLRATSYQDAIDKLVATVDDDRFREAFGAGKEELEHLVDAKTVTITKLMQVVPDGVIDPTPTLYVGVGGVCHAAYGLACAHAGIALSFFRRCACRLTLVCHVVHR